MASFLSTGIKKDGELVGVFCTQMPPESKPVEISEMQPVLTKAEETMTTAVDFYMKGTQHAQHAQPALQVSTNGAFLKGFTYWPWLENRVSMDKHNLSLLLICLDVFST